jgi:hypothetical protein
MSKRDCSDSYLVLVTRCADVCCSISVILPLQLVYFLSRDTIPLNLVVTELECTELKYNDVSFVLNDHCTI